MCSYEAMSFLTKMNIKIFFKEGEMKKPARNEFIFDLQLGRVISFIM